MYMRMACFFYCFQLGLTDLKLIYFDAFLDYIMLLFWVTCFNLGSLGSEGLHFVYATLAINPHLEAM
ncbi:hypothetical protein PVAP13_2NG041049 [Panicum virgatum]|uniref:Uncharacterized protein n=1 Tax=Panicum virgatum TaxID=38727 RepID=A0A8T0VIC0_PANVG|nr:hypothetical protein PVAP13_2NG041049 [Panicum virgatum]